MLTPEIGAVTVKAVSPRMHDLCRRVDVMKMPNLCYRLWNEEEVSTEKETCEAIKRFLSPVGARVLSQPDKLRPRPPLLSHK